MGKVSGAKDPLRRRKVWHTAAQLVTGAVAVLGVGIVAGCGGTAATNGTAPTGTTNAVNISSSGGSGCAGGKRHSIYYATHAWSHPFFTPMKTGAADGARAECLKETWTQSGGDIEDIPDVVNRIHVAVAQHPDVLVVAVVDPKAEDPAIMQAVKAGIKVIEVNAQDPTPASQAPPYLSYVGMTGSGEVSNGAAAGQALLAAEPHPKAVLVCNQLPGAPNLDDRASGFGKVMKQAGVSTTQVNCQKNTSQVVQAALLAHPNIDALYTLGSGPNGSDAIRPVLKSIGRKVTMVQSDYDLTDLKAIQAGTEVAATSQQAYLQGYLPAVIARMYFETGQAPPVVETGPLTIDKSNVAQLIANYRAGKS